MQRLWMFLKLMSIPLLSVVSADFCSMPVQWLFSQIFFFHYLWITCDISLWFYSFSPFFPPLLCWPSTFYFFMCSLQINRILSYCSHSPPSACQPLSLELSPLQLKHSSWHLVEIKKDITFIFFFSHPYRISLLMCAHWVEWYAAPPSHHSCALHTCPGSSETWIQEAIFVHVLANDKHQTEKTVDLADVLVPRSSAE